MQRDVIVKGRSLGGSSDLTLLAPLKRGFIESLETVTYRTRVKRVLEALHAARQSSHEYALARLLSDAVERVGVIHSVRVAVLEPEDKVLLAVTFDGSWEAYIRVLWEKVGPLLDLIFCSTEDYVTAHDHPFEAWLGWARRVQVETGFFYGPADFTAQDVLWHRRAERMRQRGLGTEASELAAAVPPVEKLVPFGAGPDPDDAPDVLSRLGGNDRLAAQLRIVLESMKNGLLALGALYRMTDLFRPGTADGDVLRAAAIGLLREFVVLCGDPRYAQAVQAARLRFDRQLSWLFPGGRHDVWPVRPVPPLQGLQGVDRADVQGGILHPYHPVSHGLLLLLAFDDADAAHQFLHYLRPLVTRDADPHAGQPGKAFYNVALTLAGLRACGLAEDELDHFPEDFRQGMAARAGALGDVRGNHPRRWRLPGVFTTIDQPPGAESVDLQAVHAVLQLRCEAATAQMSALDYWQGNHPLRDEVRQLLKRGIPGLRVLALQSMKRNYRAVQRPGQGQPEQRIVEHFGFADGDGQPDIEQSGGLPRNFAHAGEILVGHDSAADFAPDLTSPRTPEATRARLRWLRNGSFLVLRKYHQNVERFRRAVDEAAQQVMAATQMPLADAQKLVQGKLMGRYPDGEPLVKPHSGHPNDFDFEQDAHGAGCPLHAHVRRANPRTVTAPGARPARLMRRSMAYGPAPGKPGQPPATADRGLVFMAYNASLAEQFETVQRWLVGGNSTGASSGQSCPILGVRENGYERRFRFTYEHQGQQHVAHVLLEDLPPPFLESDAVTRLEWGLYLFAPSLTALAALERSALHAGARAPAAVTVPWRKARGRELVAQLRALEAREGAAAALAGWKAVIEDPDAIDRFDSAGVWAAIREDHGGILRTPYGVLVASRELQLQVYGDRDRYSVSGQRERMLASLGDVALGKDDGRHDGPAYRLESQPINHAIEALDEDEVFALARRAADDRIVAIAKQAREAAAAVGAPQFDVTFDAREVLDEVLAALSEAWFGLQGPFFRRGSADWAWKRGEPPLYPGHFTALSRYMFQPHPGPVPAELAQSYGKALTEAMTDFVHYHRAAGTVPLDPAGQKAPIALATFQHPLGGDAGFVARTMVGVLMGFTPTIIGAVLNVLREFHREGTFAALAVACAREKVDTLAGAKRVLHPAMAAAARMRPMPQIGWRLAREAHRLGPPGPHAVDVAAGDRIVLAMVSGTQQSLEDGQPDGRLMFGGVRTQDGPTHACPGYHAAIAAMLGSLSALLGGTEDVRRGPAALTFEIRGPLRAAAPAAPAPAAAAGTP